MRGKQEISNARDTRDSIRLIAPLMVPADATVIDNTGKSIDETVQLLLNMINK